MEYRILKRGDRFYPQFKIWFFWLDLYDDSISGYQHFGLTGSYLSLWCDTLEEALEYFHNKDIPVVEK
jgi:hypothetical protein